MKAFKQKTITVQDYPDAKFKIVIYGASKKSKFKLGDSVVVVNNDRLGYKKDRIIGFDDEGDVMLENCAWSNTRGGYKDSSLVSFKRYQEIFKNLPDNFKKAIDKEIKDHYVFLKECAQKKGSSNYIRKNKTLEKQIAEIYLANNWYKLKSTFSK